jgi:uncharacterized protein with HEPN domain
MSSKRWSGKEPAQRATDILEAIGFIRTYIKGVSFEQFTQDRKTQSAVERELLRIAEAAGKLLLIDETIEHRFPGVAWHHIRGIGNVLRHEYGRVDPSAVWDTITGPDLSNLEKAASKLC